MSVFSIRQLKNILIILLAGSATAMCSFNNSGEENESAQNTNNIPAVEAVQAKYGSLPLSERLSGTVIARNQVTLFPEINGRITEVHVQTGDVVEEGDPLISLENRQYQEQLQQAKADHRINQARLKQARSRYNELEAQYRRIKSLADQELSSQMELEQIQAQMESAEADVELAEAQLEQSQSTVEERRDQLSQTVVRAPITGTVGQRNAERGMQVSTNTQLFTIGDLDKLRVEVILTGNMLNDIEIGQTARIFVGNGAGQRALDAELSRISPFLNRITRSTEAEIDVDNEDNILRPGMFVPVDILYGESEQATLVPTSAIYTDPNTGNEGVYVATSLGSEIEPAEQVDPDNPPPLTAPTEVQFMEVNVIAEGRMEVAVEGLEPGSWIITVGQDLLSGGREQARVRASTWERILALQGMQRQFLLEKVLNQQQKSQDPT